MTSGQVGERLSASLQSSTHRFDSGPGLSPGVPSPAEVDAAKTPKGGWTRDTLAAWGVSWPPPKGWREALRERYEDAVTGNRSGRHMDGPTSTGFLSKGSAEPTGGNR